MKNVGLEIIFKDGTIESVDPIESIFFRDGKLVITNCSVNLVYTRDEIEHEFDWDSVKETRLYKMEKK